MNLLSPPKSGDSACFELQDTSTHRIPATVLIRGNRGRDPQPQAARLATQFLRQNRGILSDFDISAEQAYDGSKVSLVFQTHSRIGALPLLSPTTGRPDYGLLIKPRFEWAGLGAMLATMGWRILPTPLKLPLLPRSERKIPPWVLSTIVLFRIQAMLDQLQRRFEFTQMDLSAPRGTVNWQAYATGRISKAQFLQVPCRFPDLRDDRDLKAAIHFTLRKQLAGLESQRMGGIPVLQLIGLCQTLLNQVRDVPARQSTPKAFQSWLRNPMQTSAFREGLQAVEWTMDDRGLAGLSDLQGLPWMMPMDVFFEAWLETVVARLVQRIGGKLQIGRKRETVAPLRWDPPYLGSQKYLLPDVIMEREDETIIFDAKYKDHWEELNREGWYNLDQELRERHRADLLQLLAYANLSSARRITACLVYPCKKKTWNSLKDRGRLYHKASLSAGKRMVTLILVAMPMAADLETICELLVEIIQGN